MYCVVFILLFVLFTAEAAVEKEHQSNITAVHWVYLHYHKTGHDLAYHFGRDVYEVKPECNVVNKRTSEPSFKDLTEKDIVVIARGEYSWKDLFFRKGHFFKVLHFARDPYDMILSAFLYHSEIPRPRSEEWISDFNYHPCVQDLEVIKRYYLVHLLEYVEHSFDLSSAVENIFSLCRYLEHTYKAGTYGATLAVTKEQNIYDGIRLEACRSISDILLMGANAYQENEIAKNGSNTFMVSRRVYTKDFPVLRKDIFRNSTESLFDFLMSDSNSFRSPFYHCMNKSETVNLAIAAAYQTLHVAGNDSELVLNGTNKHITTNLMSSDDRQKYISQLMKDDVLSPVLDIVRAVLFEGVFSESMRLRYSTYDSSSMRIKGIQNNNTKDQSVAKKPTPVTSPTKSASVQPIKSAPTKPKTNQNPQPVMKNSKGLPTFIEGLYKSSSRHPASPPTTGKRAGVQKTLSGSKKSDKTS